MPVPATDPSPSTTVRLLEESSVPNTPSPEHSPLPTNVPFVSTKLDSGSPDEVKVPTCSRQASTQSKRDRSNAKLFYLAGGAASRNGPSIAIRQQALPADVWEYPLNTAHADLQCSPKHSKVLAGRPEHLTPTNSPVPSKMPSPLIRVAGPLPSQVALYVNKVTLYPVVPARSRARELCRMSELTKLPVITLFLPPQLQLTV